MGRYGFHVIDSDAHIFETLDMWRQMAADFMPRADAAQLRAVIREFEERNPDYDPRRQVHLWQMRSKLTVLPRYRPLGLYDGSQQVVFDEGGRHWEAKGAWAPLDPEARLIDMDAEGIDVAVIFPSGVAAWCAADDAGLESAVYPAYNRWMARYCQTAPARFKYVAVVSMRDIDAAVRELRRAAKDPNMAGVYLQTHTDARLLDHPGFAPLWDAAQELDLPIDVHKASSALPPYGQGALDARGNRFLQHASGNPYEQMRAIACMTGAGVFERYPRLRAAYLEAGCGWLPFWLERLDEHFRLMPESVPLLHREPSSFFKSGNCFISFDPDEAMLPHVVEYAGAGRLVYASDYPHYDGRFPNSVKIVAERADLPREVKARLLGENAKVLYPRLR